MPEISPDFGARLKALEFEVRMLRAALQATSPERPAKSGWPRQPRLAITRDESDSGGGSYPDASDVPNCYPIVFSDSTFTQTAGDRTITDTERQTGSRVPAAVACVPQDKSFGFIPEGSRAVVFNDNDRWWILAAEHWAWRIEFELTQNMTTGHASASAEIVDFYDGLDPDPDDGGITVYNVARGYDTLSYGTYRFKGSYDPTSGGCGAARGTAFLDFTTNRYRIVQMDCF